MTREQDSPAHAKSEQHSSDRVAQNRRGLAVLVLVVVVALVTLAVMTLGIGGRDDLTLAALRVESLRSLYAAESAGRVVLERVTEGAEIIEGDVVSGLPHAEGSVTLVEESEGRYRVEGRSGRAVRHLELVLAP